MRELKEKRRIRKLLFSRITIAILVVVFLLVTSATWSVFGKYRETQTNDRNAQKNLTVLEEREIDLKKEIENLKTEKGIEKEIRENFGFVKDGEEIVIIVEPQWVTQKGNESYRGSFFAKIWSSVKNFLAGN